jgi:hypothetical protein
MRLIRLFVRRSFVAEIISLLVCHAAQGFAEVDRAGLKGTVTDSPGHIFAVDACRSSAQYNGVQKPTLQ